MQSNILSILESIWFSEKQAIVYMAWLQLWNASTADIATKSWENKVTVYKILNDMVTLWYVIPSSKWANKLFSMVAPNEILDQQRARTKKLEKAMPEILGMMKWLSDRPKIKIYEGMDGLKKLFFSFQKTQETFRVLIWSREIDKDFQKFLVNDLLPIRLQSKIKTNAIISSSNIDRIKNYQEYHEYVCIENEIFAWADQVVIYDYTKVSIISYETWNLCGFVIDSKTFHDCIAWLFDVVFSSKRKI